MLPTGKEITNAIKSLGLTLVLIFLAGLMTFLANSTDAKIVIFVCLSIFLGSLTAWFIYLFSFNSNREINDMVEKYSARVHECQNHTNNLQEYCRKIEVKDNLLKLILDKRDILDLEKKVPNNTEIIVMTSKFVPEKGIVRPIIVDNIRKGVMYNYLIPSDDSDTTDYIKTTTMWWIDFKTVFTEKDECSRLLERSDKNDIVFSHDFNTLLSRCKKFHEMHKDDQNYTLIEDTLKTDIFIYFKKKIQTYKINEKYSFITIIMYLKDNISNDWDVIIKLPTSEDNDKYTAYLVPDENQSEKKNLVKSIRRFCDVHQGAEKYDIFDENEADFKW